MRVVDVTRFIQQVVRARNSSCQRAAVLRIGLPGCVQESGYVPQVAGDDGAEVRRLCQAPRPVGAGEAEVGGSQQLSDSADRVAAVQVRMGYLLKQRGDALVRPGARFRQVPGMPGWLARAPPGEDLVGAPPLVIGS